MCTFAEVSSQLGENSGGHRWEFINLWLGRWVVTPSSLLLFSFFLFWSPPRNIHGNGKYIEIYPHTYMKWRMISYLGFHVVRRCIFTLTCIFKHHKKKPMKVKLFRPRVVGTHPKSQCFASQAATQGAFSQKDPGNHRHHRGPVGLGGWLFPPKKMGGFPIGIDPFFQGIPKIFRG